MLPNSPATKYQYDGRLYYMRIDTHLIISNVEVSVEASIQRYTDQGADGGRAREKKRF